MVIVTGGAGFIGSNIIAALNKNNITNILVVDNLGNSDKWKNLNGKIYSDYLNKNDLIPKLLSKSLQSIEAIIHMGACSATTEKNADYVMENNYRYSRTLAEWCAPRGVRFIYASSGATYGNGSQGFSDSHETTIKLIPENVYGYSKHLMDLWAIKSGAVSQICGLKFFNVYGPNEYHKEGMWSGVFRTFNQINEHEKVTLFKSNNPSYKDGEQKRDFIYVKDIAETVIWLLRNKDVNGLFNLGTGQARTWKDMVHAVFKAMNLSPVIKYTDMPEELRDRYQNFTQAEMMKIRNAGYDREFTSLESGVSDYLHNYLRKPYNYL